MNDLFKEKKVRRWAVIVLSYLVCFVVLFITTSIVGEEESAKTFLKLNLIFTVLSFPLVWRFVEGIENFFLGRYVRLTTYEHEFMKFVFKLICKCAIAWCCGIFIAPYAIGKFIADRLHAE